MKAYLDGNLVKYPNDSLTEPTITLRRKDKETGEIAFSFSGDLTFTGSDYDYLYAQLVTSPNAVDNKVTLKLENDCCNPPQTYEFYITFESLEWCEGECEVTATAIEKSLANDQLTCLKNTLIYDNYAGFQNIQHPRFAYCNELRPDWMHDALLILGLSVYSAIISWIPAIATIVLLFNTVNAVINWLNSNLGTSISNVSFNGQTVIDMNTILGYLNQLNTLIVGCGRKHPSPLVRDYADNVCGKCGITFQSSILKNPGSDYHNACYVNAPIHHGTQEADTTTYWLDDNKPILNGTKFFEQLKQIFNGDFKIQSGTLTFERRDFFVPTTPWLDLTVTPTLKMCWNWSKNLRYSYGAFEYQRDGINWVGCEAIPRWSDIVEWNNPYTPLQKDEFRPFIPFAACRFRDDGIDRDVLTTYEWMPITGPIIKKYKNVMIMNSHNCFTPMLLIYDDTTPLDNARCKIFYPPGGGGVGLNQAYNYPFWFDANYPGNLYDRFWSIEDPRTSGYQGFDFEAELTFDCAILNKLDLDGTVMTSKGVAKVDSIELNFKSGIMVIKGNI